MVNMMMQNTLKALFLFILVLRHFYIVVIVVDSSFDVTSNDQYNQYNSDENTEDNTHNCTNG